MNKRVESLPKVDKSITFHCYTVICVIFWKDNTNCIWYFAFHIFLKLGKLQLLVNVQKPKVFQLQGALLPWTSDKGLCPWIPLGAPPQTPIIGASQLYLGGLQLSNTGTAHVYQTRPSYCMQEKYNYTV